MATETVQREIRFGTLLGAVVVLSSTEHHYGTPAQVLHSWRCEGCGEDGGTPSMNRTIVRNAANDHAAACRSLPETAWQPLPHDVGADRRDGFCPLPDLPY